MGRPTTAKPADADKAAADKAAADKAAADKAAADKAAADKAAADKADAEQADAEQPSAVSGEVTVIVAEAIGGTRNGSPWPAVGEPIKLPAAEAASYIQFGYVREADSA